jgi:hypothetical protein
VHDLIVAPELAAITLLDRALDIARAALLAEHLTLIDDLRPPCKDGPVVEVANLLCLRAASLRRLLARYARLVRNAAKSRDDPDDTLPF